MKLWDLRERELREERRVKGMEMRRCFERVVEEFMAPVRSLAGAPRVVPRCWAKRAARERKVKEGGGREGEVGGAEWA